VGIEQRAVGQSKKNFSRTSTLVLSPIPTLSYVSHIFVLYRVAPLSSPRQAMYKGWHVDFAASNIDADIAMATAAGGHCTNPGPVSGPDSGRKTDPTHPTHPTDPTSCPANTTHPPPHPANPFHPRLLTVPPTHLVVGLANGWAGDGKFPLFYPHHVAAAFDLLAAAGAPTPRGCAFWNILDEGRTPPVLPSPPSLPPPSLPPSSISPPLPPSSTLLPGDKLSDDRSQTMPEAGQEAGQEQGQGEVWMAKGLNAFLKVR
jgi:hypothetical protein